MSYELYNERRKFISRIKDTKIITSITSAGEFDTRCLTDEDNIKKMNRRIEKNIYF